MKYWKFQSDSFVNLNIIYFLKWLILGSLAGSVGGIIGAAFVRLIQLSAQANQQQPFLFLLLPLSGSLIVFLYAKFDPGSTGTNMVIQAIHSDEPVKKVNGPLIFVSTIVSHLAGASVGKEGAALQMGGSLGALAAQWAHLDETDQKIMIMTGMSALFGAVFGTPAGAAVFPVEMVSVGVMYYTALLPCLVAAAVGSHIAGLLGVPPEHFVITGYFDTLVLREVITLLVLGIGCALLSVFFCKMLHTAEHAYRHFLPNPYLRIWVGSGLFGLLLFFFGRDYSGSGALLMEHALAGQVPWESFLLKMLFTAVALGAGFKGGEIVPTLTIGACFGCTLSSFLGLDASFGAACGMVGLFVGATNCPMATILLAVEMFGGTGVVSYALVIALAYALSGYSSLYGAQRFMYAKTKARYINRRNDVNEINIT